MLQHDIAPAYRPYQSPASASASATVTATTTGTAIATVNASATASASLHFPLAIAHRPSAVSCGEERDKAKKFAFTRLSPT